MLEAESLKRKEMNKSETEPPHIRSGTPWAKNAIPYNIRSIVFAVGRVQFLSAYLC